MCRFSAPRERPPWLLGMRANERAVLEAWNNSGRLRDKFIAEFIRDALFLDLSGIVSGVQTVGGPAAASPPRPTGVRGGRAWL